MTDMLQTGASWLGTKLAAYASHEVTYVRDASEVTLSASFGRTELEVDTGYETRMLHTDRDFIFAAATLILGGSTTLPQAGDQIKETVGNDTYTYEVMTPEGQEQPYRYCDANRVLLRVHTTLIAVA
jgi:hypothetical protein